MKRPPPIDHLRIINSDLSVEIIICSILKNLKTMKLLMILLLVVPIVAISQFEKPKWDFPVKPGTDKWKTLKNNVEKVEACQIPKDVLSLLKTPELIQTCLNYPLLPDIFAFDNIKDGFEKFENDFNGFRELINREDVAIELLKLYKKIDPGYIPKDGTILEKGTYAFRLSFIELFVSHPLVIVKLSSSGKKEIIKEFLLKKEKKKTRPVWYQNTGIQTIYLAIVNIMQSDTNQFQSGLDVSKISPYIYSGILTNPETMDQIDQAANKYLKN